MELRSVDPRTLKANPNNPRRTAANTQMDEQLVASIKAIGIIQPPVIDGSGKALTIIAGHRRVVAAIKAGLSEIPILVTTNPDGDDVRALSENVVRAQMCPVDQWRAIDALSKRDWTEDAIGAALALPVRSIRKFQLLATVIPAILDRMALGDMPTEKTLRIIANASPEEQAAVWKKNKPKRGETISWWAIENGLNKSRITASTAAFDDAFAEAYGVVWEDDLFAQPGDPDARTTTRIDAFMAAQHAWMIEKMPTNGVVLDVGEYGNGKLPPKAHEVYGKTTRKDATIGYWVNPRTGAIETKAFIIPVTEKKRAAKSEDAETTVAKSRPAITAKGDAIIGAMRTDALHAALREAPIDDQMLIGLLTLALVSKNVDVRSPGGDRLVKHACVDALTEGGVLTTDPDTLRQTARTMLTHVLSCQQNWSDSGMTARFAGLALNAASYLPNMATQEFLSCLSKAGISAAAEAEGVAPQPTAKATRAALIQHVGEGHFVLPAARFELSESEAAIERERIATERRYATVGRYGTVAGQDDDADDGEAGYQDNDDLPDAEDAGVPDGDIEAAGDGNAPDADGLMQPKEGNDEGAARLAPPPRRNRARNTGIAA